MTDKAMKKFYTIASTLMLVLCMALMAACSSENDIVNDEPVVPEQPTKGTRTVTLKATANMGAGTRVAVEDIDGKEDAFRITGWKNGDVVKVFATLNSNYSEIPFTYNESTGEFTGEVDENFVTGGGKFVYAYVGGGYVVASYCGPNSWDFMLQIPIAISTPEDCFLFGYVDMDEDTGDLSADLTAPYALACVHNNTAEDIEVGPIDKYGSHFIDILYTSRSSAELVLEGIPTSDVFDAKRYTIEAHTKAYFVIPFKDYGLYDFAHSQTIAAPKENITPGKVYKVQVNGPAAWENELTLCKSDFEGPTSIAIQTGKNVSAYTEDENHQKLNAAGTLWAVRDGQVLKIQTSSNKIIGHDAFTDGFYRGLFAQYPVVETISGLDKLDMSGVTNMFGMFMMCNALRELDLSSWNTSNVTNMHWMFAGCFALQTLDVSSFNTSEVTTMWQMFSNCHALQTLDVSNFNTSKVTNMGMMFESCQTLQTLDVSNFNTSNVTNMESMFSDCTNLKSLTLGENFNPCPNMGRIFSGCGDPHGNSLTVYSANETFKNTILNDDDRWFNYGWDENYMSFRSTQTKAIQIKSDTRYDEKDW